MKLRRVVILLSLFFLGVISAEAQSVSLFKPFTSFRVIGTEHFDIIFPEESEPSARLLASYADRLYERVSLLLGIEVPGRIPVTFTPHTDRMNAFYRPIPAPHIMLFDTPMDPEWNSYADNLEGLFLHELTHLVAQSTKGPFARGLHRIFGSWVYPAFINAPPFMVEGVTVSFESLSGFGRANDPLIKQKLRQALHEGKFFTPFQASQAYDLPGHESMFYDYGGLFSAWLQQSYGMEKYAELWQAMGKSFYFSFSVYRSGFYRIFRNVYNVDFLEAWNAFASSMEPGFLETNHGEILSGKDRFFDALKAVGSDLYFLDTYADKVRVYNTRTGKERFFSSGAYYDYDLDVSRDGAALLLSAYRHEEDRFRAIVSEYETESGKKTGRTIEGLYKARYFRNGVIGVRSDLHNNDVVYEDFGGTSEILFSGNENLIFSGPQALDDERIVCIALRDGRRELWLYNYISRELFRIETTSGENEYWPNMRDLGVSEGKVFFSHNADDSMYKLASIDLDAMRAVFSTRDFSGGVFNPVSMNGVVYYRGSFFSGNRLLRFPEMSSALSGNYHDIKLVRLDNVTYEPVSGNIATGGDGRASASAFDSPQEVQTPPFRGEPAASDSFTSKRYFGGLRYMNPFQFWFPVPLLRFTEDNWASLSLDGGGIFSMMMDPAEINTVELLAFADIRYRMARISNFSWRNSSLGFPVTLNFFDKVEETGNAPYQRRVTGGTLTAGLSRSVGAFDSSLSLRGGYTRTAEDDGGNSAYEWDQTEQHFYLHTGLGFSNLRRRAHETFGTGMTLNLGAMSYINSFEPRVDASFQVSAETRFPLRLTLFGAYDKGGMDLHGMSKNYAGDIAAPSGLREYTHPSGLNLRWLGGGELAAGLFSFEIQDNLSHVYFNRFFGVLAARNEIYDSNGHPDAEGIAINDLRLAQSLMLKLGLNITFFPVVKIPLRVEPYIAGYWNYSNTITGKGNPWRLRAGLSVIF